jgi:hypothetical protein
LVTYLAKNSQEEEVELTGGRGRKRVERIKREDIEEIENQSQEEGGRP